MSKVFDKLKSINTILSTLLLELTPDLRAGDVNEVDDKELSYYHSKLHTLWSKLEDGEKIQDWDRNKIKLIHTFVVREMIKREFRHTNISKLDDSLPHDLQKESSDDKEEGDE